MSRFLFRKNETNWLMCCTRSRFPTELHGHHGSTELAHISSKLICRGCGAHPFLGAGHWGKGCRSGSSITFSLRCEISGTWENKKYPQRNTSHQRRKAQRAPVIQTPPGYQAALGEKVRLETRLCCLPRSNLGQSACHVRRITIAEVVEASPGFKPGVIRSFCTLCRNNEPRVDSTTCSTDF